MDFTSPHDLPTLSLLLGSGPSSFREAHWAGPSRSPQSIISAKTHGVNRRLHWPLDRMRSLFLRGAARAQLLLLRASTAGALYSVAASASAFPRPSQARVLNRRRPVRQSRSLAISAYKVARMSSQGGNGADTSTIHFSLSATSALVIQKGDITKWSVDGYSDAIVRALAHSHRPPLCHTVVPEL